MQKMTGKKIEQTNDLNWPTERSIKIISFQALYIEHVLCHRMITSALEMLSLLLVILFANVHPRPLVEITATQAAQIPIGPSTPPLVVDTELPGCTYNRQWYPAGSEIGKKADGYGGCHGVYCDGDGKLVTWNAWKCDTTTQATRIKAIATTRPHYDGCFVNGEWYPPRSDITRGSDGNGWCYGTYCGEDGQLVAWDDWDCGMTLTAASSTQNPSSTPSPQPIHAGCFQDGEWYPPGSEISNGRDGNGWCYGSICSDDSQIVEWNNWNCESKTQTPPTTLGPTTVPGLIQTTTKSSTIPELETTTIPVPLGCLQNGAWYEPGSEISRESDGEGWCHGISCNSDGKLVAWDDWNCEKTDNFTPEESQEQGCYYENEWHPYGSVFEGSDKRGCKYGAICEMDGKVTRWNEIHCEPTD